MAAKKRVTKKTTETKKAPKEEPVVVLDYQQLCYEELVKLNTTLDALVTERPENPRDHKSPLAKFLRIFT